MVPSPTRDTSASGPAAAAGESAPVWRSNQLLFTWSGFDPAKHRAFVSREGPAMISLPDEILDLAKLDEDRLRAEIALSLARLGWPIDEMLDIRQWNPRQQMLFRQSYGWTWTRPLWSPPDPIAPGVAAPQAAPYDPMRPPIGAILVPPPAWWPGR